LLLFGHFDQSIVSIDRIDLAIQLPEFGFVSCVLILKGVEDLNQATLLGIQEGELGVIAGVSILIGGSNRGNPASFVPSALKVHGSTVDSNGHGSARAGVDFRITHRDSEVREITIGHRDDSTGDITVFLEQLNLAVDFEDLGPHFGDSFGVLLGELRKLPSKSDGILDEVIRQGMGLVSNLIESCRDTVRAHKEREGAEACSPDQPPTQDATTYAEHGEIPSARIRGSSGCPLQRGDLNSGRFRCSTALMGDQERGFHPRIRNLGQPH
jgi:hypothetical protein